MNTNKLIGIILLVLGVGLLIWGFNLYDAFSSRVARAFSGSPSDKTMFILISGAICAAVGVLQLVRKSK